jgi:predicted phage-related endonuclease
MHNMKSSGKTEVARRSFIGGSDARIIMGNDESRPVNMGHR